MSRLDSRQDAGIVLEEEQTEVKRGANGQFLPGQSGNPSGKKKNTQEELDALEEIKKLAPGVAAPRCAFWKLSWSGHTASRKQR